MHWSYCSLALNHGFDLKLYPALLMPARRVAVVCGKVASEAGDYCCQSILVTLLVRTVNRGWLTIYLSCLSSSNFISRRIQYYTFHTHNSSTISQMYSSGGCQRSSVAHRADNRYFNNDTAVGKQGARGNIFIFPDVSSTLHSKYEWFNTSESNICL